MRRNLIGILLLTVITTSALAQPRGTGQDGIGVLVLYPGSGGERCEKELHDWLYETLGKTSIQCTPHPFVGGVQLERPVLGLSGPGVFPYVTLTETEREILESAVIIPDADADRIESLEIIADEERRTIMPKFTMRMTVYDEVLQLATFRVPSDVLDPEFLSALTKAAKKEIVYSIATRKGAKEKRIKLNKKSLRAIGDSVKVYEGLLARK